MAEALVASGWFGKSTGFRTTATSSLGCPWMRARDVLEPGGETGQSSNSCERVNKGDYKCIPYKT